LQSYFYNVPRNIFIYNTAQISTVGLLNCFLKPPCFRPENTECFFLIFGSWLVMKLFSSQEKSASLYKARCIEYAYRANAKAITVNLFVRPKVSTDFD
jgi:hypothetical protein